MRAGRVLVDGGWFTISERAAQDYIDAVSDRSWRGRWRWHRARWVFFSETLLVRKSDVAAIEIVGEPEGATP